MAIIAATDTMRPRSHLQVGGIEPEIGPVAFQRPLQEGANPLVDLLAQLGDLALADPAQPHGLDEVVDLPGRDSAIQASWMTETNVRLHQHCSTVSARLRSKFPSSAP
jgi:hypothetical protein